MFPVIAIALVMIGCALFPLVAAATLVWPGDRARHRSGRAGPP